VEVVLVGRFEHIESGVGPQNLASDSIEAFDCIEPANQAPSMCRTSRRVTLRQKCRDAPMLSVSPHPISVIIVEQVSWSDVQCTEEWLIKVAYRTAVN
jgi:hypothetical protein